MKAIVCRTYGPPESLTLEDLPSPVPGPGEVVVSVRAASVNFPDVLIIQNKYQVKATPPFTPGAEMAGVVKTVGPGVTRFAPGARVLGVVTQGAFAEECLAPADRLLPVPEGMDDASAASLLLAYGTAHHALTHCAPSTPGETLLVLGAAGGVGLAAVQIGKILGLRVIACASSADKLAVCRAHGADETIDYAREDLRERVKALTAGKGVDLVYDPVGGALAETALRASAWRARYLVIGFACGEIPKIPLNLALLMERSVIGVYWGAWVPRAPDLFAASVAELGAWFRAGRIRPHVSARRPLAQAPQLLRAMMERRVAGKAVIDFAQG